MAQNENISLSLANKIDILNKTQSFDARYGVYDNESDALSSMLSYGLDGRQVAVYTDKPNGKVKLYLYNQVLHKLEPVPNFEDLTAENTSFDDTTTQLGETNVQSIVETIVRRGVLKLEENLIFEVGYDKQFTSISSAIEKALEYYPSKTYTVTILIDGDFEIGENISYANTNLSFIILSTTGKVTVSSAFAGKVFYFVQCWLPQIVNFEIEGNIASTHFFHAIKSFAYSENNLKVSGGFLTTVHLNSCFSARSDNSEIKVPALNNTLGYNVQNTNFQVVNTKIISNNTSGLNITTRGILAYMSSNVTISGTSEVTGNFRYGVHSIDSSISIANNTITGTLFDIFIERSIVNDTYSSSRTVNIPKNIQTPNGIYLNTNRNNPISYNESTGYRLQYGAVTVDDIKASENEEFLVTVDDGGKLKSIETINQIIFNQYKDSTVSGDEGINLIQPDLGLPLLEVGDLQTDSSYSGELVLNIENNNTATAKVIELFGAEIYNSTNPSSGITTKITFTLDFFNQVGDNVDYVLTWDYMSSGEILFGEYIGTIDNTSDLSFILLVTGHNTDNFVLKKARLCRLYKNTKRSVLSLGAKWHQKLTNYYNNVIRHQGNNSSVLPYINLINQKLIENDGNVLFLTYENTTSLTLRVRTESGSGWQVDWDGSGDWQTWPSVVADRTKTFASPTSGVAFIRSSVGNPIEDLYSIYSNNGNWNFDISALSSASYMILFSGGQMTLTGDISVLSNVSYQFYFDGHLMTLTGDISALSNVSYYVYFVGNNMQLTYTTTPWLTIPSNIFHLRLSSGRLTQSEVDQLFIDLNNAGTTGTSTIDLRGSNAAPSSASASARTALASRGYTVLHS